MKVKFPKRKALTGADTPWTTMNDRPSVSTTVPEGNGDASANPNPTFAAFSPNQQTAIRERAPASVLIHQKSALLAATPPHVTRALAYSHPFIVPLNYLAGLLSWTTGDPWESFLLLAGFWFTLLYLDYVLRWAGPLVLATALIMGMKLRKYSPLYNTTWGGGEQKQRSRADSEPQQRKTLDEILYTLQIFTNRCDVLLDPFLRLTAFLSTQVSATSAKTTPALTSMFIRLLCISPIWYLLTLPPLYIVTTKSIFLVLGSVGLTWHSRPARASRAILWRSRLVRTALSFITGLHLDGPYTGEKRSPPPLPAKAPPALAKALAKKGNHAGVRFTFALYENQRRWVGLGFSANLLPSDRGAWTDEHNNNVPEKEVYPLPETDSTAMRWRWVPGSEWRIDPSWTDDPTSKSTRAEDGWTFYDNKWKGGSRNDDWTKWTRRRRWIRDAELEETSGVPDTAAAAAAAGDSPAANDTDANHLTATETFDSGDNMSLNTVNTTTTTTTKKRHWFSRRLTNDKNRGEAVPASAATGSPNGPKTSNRSPEEDVHTPLRFRETQLDRSIGDGVAEGLS